MATSATSPEAMTTQDDRIGVVSSSSKSGPDEAKTTDPHEAETRQVVH